MNNHLLEVMQAPPPQAPAVAVAWAAGSKPNPVHAYAGQPDKGDHHLFKVQQDGHADKPGVDGGLAELRHSRHQVGLDGSCGIGSSAGGRPGGSEWCLLALRRQRHVSC